MLLEVTSLRCPEVCRGVTPQCFAELLIAVASDFVFDVEPRGTRHHGKESLT